MVNIATSVLPYNLVTSAEETLSKGTLTAPVGAEEHIQTTCYTEGEELTTNKHVLVRPIGGGVNDRLYSVQITITLCEKLRGGLYD